MSTKQRPTLAGWQATGLCLAAASVAATGGLGILLGAVLLAPVIYALVRLRGQAPDAASTADLVGSTLGRRATTFTRIAQVTGYSLLAIACAQAITLPILPIEESTDPFAPLILNPWLWSLYAVTAIVVAAVLAFALPDRVIASIAAVLAAVGLLIVFYCGLAVLAHVWAGTALEDVNGYSAPALPALDVASIIAVLAVGLAGFEIVTIRKRPGSSAGWPMGLAVGALTVCALVVWAAGTFGGQGGAPFGSPNLGVVFSQLYGDTGNTIVNLAAVLYTTGALLALMWGIARLTSVAVFAAVITAMAAVVVLLSFERWTLGYVGALVLFAVYGIIVVANARIPAAGAVAWWLRIVVPVVLLVVVLLPLLDAEFSFGSLRPVIFAAGALAVATAAAMLKPYADSGDISEE